MKDLFFGRKTHCETRKREQKVWFGSKQVYHLDDDQHQQNQSRIQALPLSISLASRLLESEAAAHQQNMTLFNINVITNANENKKNREIRHGYWI